MTTDRSTGTGTGPTPLTGPPPSAAGILDTFTGFFRERGHRLLPPASLVRPPGDPVLFTTSGMHPLTPYLEGRLPHPLGPRLTGVQRCLRTTDLDEVGDRTHLTVFEMLGSWSLGDYGLGDSLRTGYELLTDGFGIDPGHLHATVFGGGERLGPDTACLRVWEDLGVPAESTGDDNWWSNGPTGLCGPDSEIFVWTGGTPPRGTPTGDPRWVEIWNHVSMAYRRLDDGTLRPLERPCVDTGMGFERLVTILQGRSSVFGTDLFEPWMRLLPPLFGFGGPDGSDATDLRVVADHLRSAVVMIGDGVVPAGTGRGYVLRRLLRRVLTVLRRRSPEQPPPGLGDLPDELARHTLGWFRLGPEGPLTGRVRQVLVDEDQRFRAALERGRRVLARPRFSGPLTEQDYRYLHATHGVPREVVALLR